MSRYLCLTKLLKTSKFELVFLFSYMFPLKGIAALIIKMITSYPLLVICGRGAFDGLYAEICRISTEDFILHEKRRRIIITTLWFISTVTLAVSLSNIGVVIEMLGCLACANIFIFPGTVALLICHQWRHYG